VRISTESGFKGSEGNCSFKLHNGRGRGRLGLACIAFLLATLFLSGCTTCGGGIGRPMHAFAADGQTEPDEECVP
jgi:hypothetical protein